MKGIARKIAMVMALVATTGVAMAHHSYASFDMSKSIEISGTIQKWAWTNPHVHLFVAVPADGKVQQWVFESTSPSMLAQRGVAIDSFHVGDKVIIIYHPHRSSKFNGELQTVKYADGSKVVEVGMERDRTPVGGNATE